MKPDTQSQINLLDTAYQKLSGRSFRASGLLTGREYAWSNFLQAGYTLKDLDDVIVWIRRGIHEGKRHEAALGFRRLILDLMVFDDELATCRAERRNAKPAPSPKQQVLREAHTAERTTKPAPETTKHVAPIVDHWIAKMREEVG